MQSELLKEIVTSKEGRNEDKPREKRHKGKRTPKKEEDKTGEHLLVRKSIKENKKKDLDGLDDIC